MSGLQRNHKEKIGLISDLQRRYPSSSLIPAAMLEKADAYTALGDNTAALQAYDNLLRDYPRHHSSLLFPHCVSGQDSSD